MVLNMVLNVVLNLVLSSISSNSLVYYIYSNESIVQFLVADNVK